VLLAACARHGHPLTRATLDRLVQESDKGRFGYDDSGERVRAKQGHSTAVELAFEAAMPRRGCTTARPRGSCQAPLGH
jgi:putative RNA 2'-phosphotransferase